MLLSKRGQWRRWVRACLFVCALTTKYTLFQSCRGRTTTEANREIGRGLSEANCYTQRRDNPERIACNFTADLDSTIEILPVLGNLCGYRVRVIKPDLDTFEHTIGGGQIIGRICYRPDWGVRSSKALSWGMTDDHSLPLQFASHSRLQALQGEIAPTVLKQSLTESRKRLETSAQAQRSATSEARQAVNTDVLSFCESTSD